MPEGVLFRKSQDLARWSQTISYNEQRRPGKLRSVETLELWLIRHGETNWNAEGRIQGQMNSQLTPKGIWQAQALSRRLAHEAFDHVYSSDSDRAQHTARLALPGSELQLDKRLRELNYGVIEGKTEAEFSAEERTLRAAMYQDPFSRRMPGGETWSELIARIGGWISELPKSGRVIAFSHGGTIRAAVFSLIGHPKAYEWNLLMGNTGITRLRLSEVSKVVVTLNDTAHLESLGG